MGVDIRVFTILVYIVRMVVVVTYKVHLIILLRITDLTIPTVPAAILVFALDYGIRAKIIKNKSQRKMGKIRFSLLLFTPKACSQSQ